MHWFRRHSRQTWARVFQESASGHLIFARAAVVMIQREIKENHNTTQIIFMIFDLTFCEQLIVKVCFDDVECE